MIMAKPVRTRTSVRMQLLIRLDFRFKMMKMFIYLFINRIFFWGFAFTAKKFFVEKLLKEQKLYFELIS